jgi:hypothetical protein
MVSHFRVTFQACRASDLRLLLDPSSGGRVPVLITYTRAYHRAALPPNQSCWNALPGLLSLCGDRH